MPGGKLPREETELVILRVAHNTGSDYEWGQHERMARGPGLATRRSPASARAPRRAGWSERRALLLRAADELHSGDRIGDELWAELARQLDEVRLIELCMLIGHYEMLAMTLNSLDVEPDFERKAVKLRCSRPARQALPDHRRGKRHRPRDGDRRRRQGRRALPHRSRWRGAGARCR